MDTIGFPATVEDKRRLEKYAARHEWTRTTAIRFLVMAGLDLEEHLERRATLASKATATTRRRKDNAA
jgi:hypothetical protein